MVACINSVFNKLSQEPELFIFLPPDTAY